MDLWVVAAAAGAGYVAKNLQNLSIDKRESSGAPSFKYSANVQSESRNLLQQLRDKTCPFRRLARKKAETDALLENHLGVDSSEQLINRHSEGGGLASSSGDALQENEFPEDYNLCRISKLPHDFSTEEELEFEDGEIRNFPRVNSGKLIRNRKRRENLIRPLNPLGSCIDAQICREHEREEETINVLIPSMSVARAILVTDGTRMFNRSNSDSSFKQFEGGKEEVKRENVDYIKGNSLRGHDGMLHFITGMIIGISSVATASKNIVDKLNKQLKQTQNLVEDLYEELDMKDMVTVKELAYEGYLRSGGSNTPISNQKPNASPSDVRVNGLPNFDKSTELMSKIEAELEAELEMLERNMMESKLEQTSNVVELGSDFEPDIVHGDLKPMTGIQVHGDAFEAKNETTDTTPNNNNNNNNNNYSQPPNYAVCPWELSLRLHELIESRLEARVKELETALGNTENGFQLQKGYSYSETRSLSSSPYTSAFINEGDEYKNLNRISSRGEYKDQEKEDEEFFGTASEQGAIWEKHSWSGFMSDEDCRDEDDGCDEDETLLLKRIIERTKSGSSVVFELLRSSDSRVMA